MSFVRFLRDAIALAEDDLGLWDYHLRLCAGRSAAELQSRLGMRPTQRELATAAGLEPALLRRRLPTCLQLHCAS